MTTVHAIQRGGRRLATSRQRGRILRQSLLACGVLSSLLYATMLIVVPMRWDAYSSAAQTVSELSAIGAPTRELWVPLGTLYTLLVAAFGCGVLMVAARRRLLRVTGAALIAHGLLGLFWPPMHLRGAAPTLTDALHIAFSIATVLLMMLAIGAGSAAFGRAFRLYSRSTLVTFVVFGFLTFLESPGVAANLPTPWIGLWERINIGAFLLWVVVLAITLLRHRSGYDAYGT